MTSLLMLLGRLDELSDDETILAARPWTADSPAASVLDESDEAAAAAGLEYLVEVCLAKEAVAVWSAWHGGCEPTPAEVVAVVVHYAEHDAYPPVVEAP